MKLWPAVPKPGSTARPSRPRSQKSWTCGCRSTTWVGVGSAGESNTLTMPPFSPTNTLPPGAKAIAVGRVSPDQTATSENPLGTAAATAGDVGAADRVARPRTSPPRSGGGAAATGAGDSSAAPKATSRANEQIRRAVLRAEFPPVS